MESQTLTQCFKKPFPFGISGFRLTGLWLSILTCGMNEVLIVQVVFLRV